MNESICLRVCGETLACRSSQAGVWYIGSGGVPAEGSGRLVRMFCRSESLNRVVEEEELLLVLPDELLFCTWARAFRTVGGAVLMLIRAGRSGLFVVVVLSNKSGNSCWACVGSLNGLGKETLL